MDERVKNFFISFLPMLFCFALQILVSIFIVELFVVFILGTFTGSSFSELMSFIAASFRGQTFNSGTLCIYGAASLLTTGFWYKKFLKKKKGDFHEPGKPYEVLTEAGNTLKGYNAARLFLGALLAGVTLQVVMNFLMAVIAIAFPDSLTLYETVSKVAGIEGNNLSAISIIYLILGPVAEEFTFRGLTFGYARRALPFVGANLIQAILFGVIHVIPIQGIVAFVMGLLLGYLYGCTRNIIITIIVHLVFNFSSLILSVIPIGEVAPTAFFIILLLSLFLAYIGVKLILSSVPAHFNNRERRDSVA